MTTIVAHWEDRDQYTDWVYCGRRGGGPFGNPYYLGSRETNIAAFRRYFYRRIETDPFFKSEVDALQGKVLLCHCAPLPCHLDVIAEYLDS